jgi:ketosteroid isomerase-like protein
MKKLLMVFPLIFLLCFTFSCQKQVEEVAEESVVGVEADVEAIKAWLERYVALNNEGDFESYGDFWTESVVWLPPGAPAVIGKEAILDFARPFFEQYNIHQEFKTEEIRVADSFAFDGWLPTAYGTVTSRLPRNQKKSNKHAR